ncbi:MAG TPA: bifunctional precorrin-2 dehydrogenase/sirohydrochlorin ferrochelatase [Acidimicrobiales bacterium]|nr:bifunctional precorrin-2 dehydrogenase/sirohydrochlorin ferrochelatase [Acidimicrobiales bacterium]
MPVEPPAYPVNLLVAGRRVLVVGGGTVALEKVRGLLAAEAVVRVVAPAVVDELRALPVEVEERSYARGDVAGHRLVVACTDDPAVNQAVHDDAEAAGIWVNAADDPARCTYTLPARIDRGRLLVTVSTSGRSPAFTAWLRDQLAAQLGPEHDALLDLLADARAELAAAGRRPPAASWREALDSGMLELIRNGRLVEAEALLDSILGSGGADPDTR